MTDFRPTHRTAAGTPVQALGRISQYGLRIQTVDGFVTEMHEGSLTPVDGFDSSALADALAKAEEEDPFAPEEYLEMEEARVEREHAAHALRCAPCGQEASARVTLANWAKATDASRATLAAAVARVLEMSIGSDAHRVRHTLEKALAEAGEELAKFTP